MAAERLPGNKPAVRRASVALESAEQHRVNASSSRRINRLKDDVYREMLRLESNRPGAEMGLALALLRAVAQRESLCKDESFQQWLTHACGLGLNMIENSLNQGAACLDTE